MDDNAISQQIAELRARYSDSPIIAVAIRDHSLLTNYDDSLRDMFQAEFDHKLRGFKEARMFEGLYDGQSLVNFIESCLDPTVISDIDMTERMLITDPNASDTIYPPLFFVGNRGPVHSLGASYNDEMVNERRAPIEHCANGLRIPAATRGSFVLAVEEAARAAFASAPRQKWKSYKATHPEDSVIDFILSEFKQEIKLGILTKDMLRSDRDLYRDFYAWQRHHKLPKELQNVPTKAEWHNRRLSEGGAPARSKDVVLYEAARYRAAKPTAPTSGAAKRGSLDARRRPSAAPRHDQ